MKIKLLTPFLLSIVFLVSCLQPESNAKKTWNNLVKSSENTVVKLAYDLEDGFPKWIREEIVPKLKKEYFIDLRYEKWTSDDIYQNLLEAKKDEEKTKKSDIDFFVLKRLELIRFLEAKLLYGPFVEKLNNFIENFTRHDPIVIEIEKTDSKYLVAPINQRQLCFFYNYDIVESGPRDRKEFLEYLKNNPGKFTYPSPVTPTGRAFISSLIYHFVAEREFQKDDLSTEQIKAIIRPAFDFLIEIKPYLYGKGKYHPVSTEKLDELFNNGTLSIIMSFDYMHAEKMIADRRYPDYVKPIEFLESSVAEIDYAVIAHNAYNKSGAMVAINAILDETVQNKKYRDKNYPGIPVYSPEILSSELANKIDKNQNKKTIILPSKLTKIRKKPIPDKYWIKILNEWRKIN